MMISLGFLQTRIQAPSTPSLQMDWEARVASLNDRRFKVRIAAAVYLEVAEA